MEKQELIACELRKKAERKGLEHLKMKSAKYQTMSVQDLVEEARENQI